MLNETTNQDLLKVYQTAQENAQCFHDIDDKLESFGDVVRFCENLPECAQDESTKKYQVLSWVYRQMGDLALQKSGSESTKTQALAYYQNALFYSKTNEDALEILKKIRFIYQDFQDLKNVLETSEEMISLIDDAFKVEAFLHLADEATDQVQEAYFLQEALKYVSDEKISFLKQCRQTLGICERLLKIYESVGKRNEALKIKEIQSQTKRLLH